MIPVDDFKDDLTFANTVEDDRCTCAMLGDLRENRARHGTREQTSHQRLPVSCLDDRAVAQDQREWTGKGFENGPGKIVAAACGERDFYARVDRSRNGGAIGAGDSAVTVEKRTVDVEGNQADHSRTRKGAIVLRLLPCLDLCPFQN